MQNVLGQLITVPGVVGGMVYDLEGKLLSAIFPPLFRGEALADAARVLVDATAGLETVTGEVRLVDLRFGEGRIVVRTLAGAHLVLLCAARTNLELLNISSSLALPKLEKLVAALPPPEGAEPPPAQAASQQAALDAGKEAEERDPAEPPGEDPGFFRW